MAKKTQYAITQKEMAKLLSDHMNAKLGSYAHTTGDLILAAYRIGISKAALVCDGRAESHDDPVCINEGRKCAAAIRHFCDPANSETSNVKWTS